MTGASSACNSMLYKGDPAHPAGAPLPLLCSAVPAGPLSDQDPATVLAIEEVNRSCHAWATLRWASSDSAMAHALQTRETMSQNARIQRQHSQTTL